LPDGGALMGGGAYIEGFGALAKTSREAPFDPGSCRTVTERLRHPSPDNAGL